MDGDFPELSKAIVKTVKVARKQKKNAYKATERAIVRRRREVRRCTKKFPQVLGKLVVPKVHIFPRGHKSRRITKKVRKAPKKAQKTVKKAVVEADFATARLKYHLLKAAAHAAQQMAAEQGAKARQLAVNLGDKVTLENGMPPATLENGMPPARATPKRAGKEARRAGKKTRRAGKKTRRAGKQAASIRVSKMARGQTAQQWLKTVEKFRKQAARPKPQGPSQQDLVKKFFAEAQRAAQAATNRRKAAVAGPKNNNNKKTAVKLPIKGYASA